LAAFSGFPVTNNVSGNGVSSNPFVGTWEGERGVIIIRGDSTWEMESDKGAYTSNGNSATLAVSHTWWNFNDVLWLPAVGRSYTAEVSAAGALLTVEFDWNDSGTFTRMSGEPQKIVRFTEGDATSLGFRDTQFVPFGTSIILPG
jgi:hypothetical protein